MNPHLFLKNNILLILVSLFILLANSNFAVEQKSPIGFPTFAIYTNKIPVYATLSGSFTLHPEREANKAESYFKDIKQSNNIGSGTSYLSVKFEDKVFKFHELTNIKSEWNIEDSSITISGQIPLADVEIFMVLKNKKSRDGSFFVTYGAINRTNRIVDIGFRSLIDVGTEANDGIPLKVCTDSTVEKEIYSNEFKFTPFNSGYWETYESDTDSSIGIRNHLIGQGNTPPDQIAFVNWERAFATDWKYFTNKHVLTSSDSAVLLWWNPQPVKQGERREVSTEYEIKRKNDKISFDLIEPETGSGRLHLKATNNTNSPKEVSYQLDAGNNAFLGKGSVDLIVKEKNGKLETNHNLPVNLARENRDQSPKFWKSSKYPIIYNSDKDGLKLKGVLRAKDSGKKLGETDLISVKSIQNSFVYLGEVDLKEFSGEVLVEIFKQ